MLAWRIDRARRPQEKALSGEAARSLGGRWNQPGVAVVYAAEHLSLAALEKFIHIEKDEKDIPLVAYKLEVPSEAETLAAANLPADWRSQEGAARTKTLGSEWLKSGEAVALKVPSAIIPAEHNILINPAHADFAKLQILAREPFSFDARLWK